MAAPKRPTHVVVHPKLCLSVEVPDGKGGYKRVMQRVPKDTQLTIDKDDLPGYERLITTGKIASLSDVPTLDLSKSQEPEKG